MGMLDEYFAAPEKLRPTWMVLIAIEAFHLAMA